jgi:ADP-ribose pyrophosphatase YjhB (NUDIX family)
VLGDLLGGRSVIRRPGQLLVRAPAGPGLIVAAGGHVEPGEPAEPALVRVIAQELGTEAEIPGLPGWQKAGTTFAHHEIIVVCDLAAADAAPVSPRPRPPRPEPGAA